MVDIERLGASLQPGHFAIEKHRRIFLRMGDPYAQGEGIDRATAAEELRRHGQSESVGDFVRPGVAGGRSP